LVFFNSGEAPIRCAVEVSQGLRAHPELRLRMGIHTGPVSTLTDVNDRSNIAGAGINIAQRVMDLGDAGHILLSKRAAEDLIQYRQWQPYLHDLGEVEVKHGINVAIVNLHTKQVGNPELPAKVRLAQQKERAGRTRKRVLFGAATVVGVLTVAAALSTFFRAAPHPSETAPPISEKSIAVLPFENLSAEKD